jgi:hypothetical protein
MRLRLRGLAATALLVAGCSTSANKADNDALCSKVRADLAGAGLATTPSQAQARAAATRLDAVLTAVADPGLHEDVVRLHQHLHDLDVAWSRRGPDDVSRAAERARTDAERIAKACRASPAEFLGG